MTPHSKRRSTGFSLVEMMVALVFVSVLMAGMLQIYGSAMSSISTTTESMAANRTKRWAITAIEDDFQSAGYFYYSPFRALPGYISVDTAAGQNALMILPNNSTTYNTADPATSSIVSEKVWFDEVQFLEDQPLQIRAELSGTPSANNALSLTVLSGNLGDVQAGDFVFILDELYELCRVASVTVGSATTGSVTLDTTATAMQDGVDGSGTGATAGLKALTHFAGAGVVFVRPLQVVRYTVLPLALDPAYSLSMIPCLVRDQAPYPSTGARIVWPAANAAMPAGFTRTLIAENVSGAPFTTTAPTLANQYGFRVDISPDNGTTWCRAGTTTWPAVAANLNTWLAIAGNATAPYTSVTNSAYPVWYRNIPALFRLDVTTRTALKRSDPNVPANRVYTYRSQTLLCQPRNFTYGN
ncbi:MAG: hypothetical protein HGB30_04900 [Holophagaceae bacterium]|nr:hypothetical protein [Holophagaceae bacterium]